MRGSLHRGQVAALSGGHVMRHGERSFRDTKHQLKPAMLWRFAGEGPDS